MWLSLSKRFGFISLLMSLHHQYHDMTLSCHVKNYSSIAESVMWQFASHMMVDVDDFKAIPTEVFEFKHF